MASSVSPGAKFDPEQSFSLIDTLIPFAVCLYHRIVPLRIEGQSLILGMVDSDNQLVLDYVKPMVASYSYFIKRVPLEPSTHQELLSQYLKYSQAQQEQQQKKPQPQEKESQDLDSSSTMILTEAERKAVIQEADPDQGPSTMILSHTEREALLQSVEDTVSPRQPKPNPWQCLDVQVSYPGVAFPVLLQRLLPPSLAHELLARALTLQVPQLYLDLGSTGGRVVWHRNNSLRLVLDKVRLSVLNQIIEEMKRLLVVQQAPATKGAIQKYEMLRLFQGEKVLVRIYISSGSRQGERMSIQLFQGERLRQYQQEQIDRLGGDLLKVLQEANRRCQRLQARRRINHQPLQNLGEIQTLLANLQNMIHDETSAT